MKSLRTRRGSNATEFVLSLPLLLIMASGIIDLSWYLVQYNAAVNAVREGARAGAAAAPDANPVSQANAAALNAASVYGLSESVTCTETTLPLASRTAYRCATQFSFTPLFGFPGVPLPGEVSYALTMMGQVQ